MGNARGNEEGVIMGRSRAIRVQMSLTFRSFGSFCLPACLLCVAVCLTRAVYFLFASHWERILCAGFDLIMKGDSESFLDSVWLAFCCKTMGAVFSFVSFCCPLSSRDCFQPFLAAAEVDNKNLQCQRMYNLHAAEFPCRACLLSPVFCVTRERKWEPLAI